MSQLSSNGPSDAGVGALFDLSFTRFITISIIKFVYILAIAGLVLSWLVMVGAGFSFGGIPGGLGAIVAASVLAVLNLLLVRMGLELVVVIFRIGQYTQFIAAGHAPTGGFPVGPVE